MRDTRNDFEIFICGGSQHVAMLTALLPKLRRSGRVHLASSFLSAGDLRQLHGLYDVLHTPRHSDDGYCNFELFSIRDINRLATAPYFVKLDADVQLDDDWIDYVEECLGADSDAVLFGPQRGSIDVNLELSGPPVRKRLGRDIRVANAPKVIGGFYVGRTAFFKEQRRFMDATHRLLWQFEEGVRLPGMTVVGDTRKFRRPGNEDTLRNLIVHAAGAGDRLHIVDSRGRVRIIRDLCTS